MFFFLTKLYYCWVTLYFHYNYSVLSHELFVTLFGGTVLIEGLLPKTNILNNAKDASLCRQNP